MSIGYACLTIGVSNTSQKSCIQKNATDEKLMEIISHNLNALENIIDYNKRVNIRLFRISSDIIPFGSSPVNTLKWWELFASQLEQIGEKIKSHGIRVSMHPGQYTVLNSPDEGVMSRAVEDLNYHALFLDCLGVGPENKIILHIGGVYKDKSQAIRRFIKNYQMLSFSVRQRLVLENDDKSYNIDEVLKIGLEVKVPVVFDNLHHAINPVDESKSDLYWIEECGKTWKEKDGRQKIHYSQQDFRKRPGSHSTTIGINEFMEYYRTIHGDRLDIMLEVKDKNLSAVKCINCTAKNESISALELEWSRYKYTVLEHSQKIYQEIRRLLGNKSEYPAVQFYTLIEEALKKESTRGNSINGVQHVWGYFKELATEKEKADFQKKLEAFQQGKALIKTIKSTLWKMTVRYEQFYLLESYYYIL